MGFVARLFGKANNSQAQQMSQLQVSTREQTRRQLLTMALRDTLKRNGLRADCITTEGLLGTVAGHERGMHVQLILKDWQPALLSYVVALEHAFRATLRRLDPLSPSWMLDLTWRFEPSDPLSWPQLPIAQPRKPAGTAQARSSSGPRSTLDNLLQLNDAAFQHRAGVQADFSPTLPMQRR